MSDDAPQIQYSKTRIDRVIGQKPIDAPAPLQPWEQMPGEPHLWYRRFFYFLSIGPARTLRRAYEVAQLREIGVNGEPILRGASPSSAWRKAQADWNWVARAAAFDEAQVVDWAERHKGYIDVLTYESVEVAISVRRKIDELLESVLSQVEERIMPEDGEPLSLSVATTLLSALGRLRKDTEGSLRLWLGEATEIREDTAQVDLASNIQAMIAKVYAVKDKGADDASD